MLERRRTRPGGLPALGELERAVLEHLWTIGRADVRQVYDQMGAPRRITLNTIQSTMERLYRKGLLGREKVSHAYIYRPAVSRQELAARAVEEVMAELLGGEAEPMLSAFVDLAARAGDEQLDQLERLIADRRRARSGSKP